MVFDKGNVVMGRWGGGYMREEEIWRPENKSKERKQPVCTEELITKTKKGEEQRKRRARLLRVKNTKL